LINSPDTDKIQLILDEICAHSKKEILKVQRNLDVIYGPYSDEKKNGINQLHEHLKAHVTVRIKFSININGIIFHLFYFIVSFFSHFWMKLYWNLTETKIIL